MNVLRAHGYRGIEAIRADLSRLPASWLEAIAHWPWIVLPDDISPLYVGLMECEWIAHDGRKYSESGGWCAYEDTSPNWRWRPHIYLDESSAWAATHEAAHALERTWHVPVVTLFRPERALYPYMASNAAEYFACGLDAFCWPEQRADSWNRGDLAKADPDLFAYLKALAGAA